MTSLRKAQTNRSNALRSTGPKTPYGKDASSKNALKHGVLSQEVLLPGEDKAVFLTLGELPTGVDIDVAVASADEA